MNVFSLWPTCDATKSNLTFIVENVTTFQMVFFAHDYPFLSPVSVWISENLHTLDNTSEGLLIKLCVIHCQTKCFSTYL